MQKKQLIFFNSRDELSRIDIDRIAYFEGDGNYTNIVTANKLKAVIGMNLSQMEKTLAERLGERATIFMRIGKRFIINMNYVFQVNVAKQRLVLSDQKGFAFQLPVSKEALKKVKELILKAPSTSPKGESIDRGISEMEFGK